MDGLKSLVGKTIRAIFVSPGEGQLLFKTDEGDVGYHVWGDCCSESWFADLTGVDALIGGTVTETEDVKYSEPNDDRTRQEHDVVYGYKIKTSKGHADLSFRNSSNGYYGGDLESGDAPEATVAITDDWSA